MIRESGRPPSTINHLEMFTYDKFWPLEGGVVVLYDVGILVPDQNVETLVHSAVKSWYTLEVECIRGFVYHRAILNRLRGNCKIYCYLLLLFIIAYFA